MMSPSRRTFLKDMMIYGSAFPFFLFPLPSWRHRHKQQDLAIHIFSKHLQFLNFRETGEMAAEMGFAGVDLTVRPGGHVSPDKVQELLPQAIKEIEAGGSSCQMITTAIESIKKRLDREVIAAAGQSGVKYYRSNWFKYLEGHSMPESIKIWQEELNQLGNFNKEHQIVGCYQNHAGTKIGASYWEVDQLLKQVDPQYFGAQYDIRHAVAEGGHSWKNGLQLLKDRIKTIVLKDFKWGKVNGKWKAVSVPIGQGMVDFTSYFQFLKAQQINVPVSLHLEYPLGGAEKGKSQISVDKKVVFKAMTQDLKMIQKLWLEA